MLNVFVQPDTLALIAVRRNAQVTGHAGPCSRGASVRKQKAFVLAIKDGVGSNACITFAQEAMLPAQGMVFA